MGAAKDALQRPLVVTIQALADVGHAAGQAFGIGQALVAGFQLGQGVGCQRPLRQIVHLVTQQFDALRTILATAELAHALASFAPLRGGVVHVAQQVVVVGEGVEQVHLVAARKQRLVFVLAVDFHQQCGQFAELPRVGRAAVDPRARTALAADHAPQLAGAILVEFLALKPFARLRQIGQIELRRQLRTLAAGAHHGAVRARAGQQHQRIHQQRFARAGFAADDRQAGERNAQASRRCE